MAKKMNIEELSQYKIDKNISKLTERDYNALNNIYNFRCLSFEQLYNLNYKKNLKTGEDNSERYAKKKLKLLLELKFIYETIIFDKDIPPIYSLTMQGINALKKYKNWPDNIYDENKRIHLKGYLVESELNVKERFIAHQYNLNKFVLMLEDFFKDKNFKYEDEKHINSFVGIRPDGIFTIKNTTYFLEMDMGTENEKQLKEKWDHYRIFLNSNEYLLRERKVVVLFIVDGIVRVNQRISLIKNTIYTNFIDCFSSDIELFINTPFELINTLKERIESDNNLLLEVHKTLTINNFKIIDDSFKIKEIFGESFSLFARKTTKNRTYDFIFEDYEYSPMSSIYKSVYFDKLTANFKKASNPNLKLILVCDDEIEAFRAYKLFYLKDILFTTKQRLFALDFHEAIFSLDEFGNIFCFKNEELIEIEKFGMIKI